MLEHCLRNYSLAKIGVAQEIDCAKHYFSGAGRPKWALYANEANQKSIINAEEARKREKEEKEKKEKKEAESIAKTRREGGNPSGGETPGSFEVHNQARVASRPKTYAIYARPARKTASSISKDDMSGPHTAMATEG